MDNKTGTAAKQAKANTSGQGESPDNFKEKIVQKVGETKGKVTENLSNAASKVHEKSDTALEFLDSGADNLNKYAHQAIEKANQFGHRAADAINNSSEYINNFDYNKSKQQVVKTVKDNPQIGFAIAGLFGLIIGLFIGRKNSK